MALSPAVSPTIGERDPIADARALVAMAVSLGTRARNAHRLGQVTDRKASLYVNTLVRHAARLLQSTGTHDVPILNATARGPGGRSVHYVIRHDQLDGPPVAQRFVTVGSDARLRCCVVSTADGSRIWADYDVSSAPDGLTLRVVLDALSELIHRLEQAVTRLEAKQIARGAQLEADIASAKARLTGRATGETAVNPVSTPAAPVRPWPVLGAGRELGGAQAAKVAMEPAAAADEVGGDAGGGAVVEPDEVRELVGVGERADSDTAARGQEETGDARPRGSLRLTRLRNAI